MTEQTTSKRREGQKMEERFRLLVESVKDYAIFMLDVHGNVASWNAGAKRLKGYEAHEIVGSHFSRFYPAEDIAAGKPEMELTQAVADGRVEDEGWRLRKDGSRFWADVIITALFDPETGELVGYGKVTRDLTERKAAEERLRHSEEQFRRLVEAVDEYAIFMLNPTGHVATWNAGAQKIKGYTFEEIVGEHFEHFYTPADRESGKPARLLKIAEELGHVRDQGMRMRKNGTTFHADVLITAVRGEGGKLIGFSKVTRDITDQVRTRQMEMAKIAAERANQAKDDFLAVLSHELRTPLTPVLTATSYLLENLSTLSRADLEQELTTIRRNTLLEAQLIDDLLDLTRLARGKVELRLEAVDLHAVFVDVVAIVKEAAVLKESQIVTQLDAPQPWIWGDPTRIRQVFWNLLNNAVKFTPAGGYISIRTSNDERGKLIAEVTDNGIGIESENASRIFNAFEQGERTVTRQFGGLGLGLAITRSLVQMHGGTIAVRSEGAGKGATFCVTLKAIAHTEAAEGPAPVPEQIAAGLRILLVEDHEDTRRILARLLRKDGHTVTMASELQLAVELLSHDCYDVLVSDIGLPDGSGHDLMRRARQLQPQLHGVALSGFGMQEDIDRSTEAGFKFHLTKPVDPAVLRTFLRKLKPRV